MTASAPAGNLHFPAQIATQKYPRSGALLESPCLFEPGIDRAQRILSPQPACSRMNRYDPPEAAVDLPGVGEIEIHAPWRNHPDRHTLGVGTDCRRFEFQLRLIDFLKNEIIDSPTSNA